MQLHELKAHPVIRAFAYAGFALIIISFVFFYGWSSTQQRRDDVNRAFARYRSDDPLSFLPWKKWKYIKEGEFIPARAEVRERKLALLGPQLASILNQRGTSIPVSDDEAIQQAMDTRILNEEGDRLGIVVTPEEVDGYIRQVSGSAQALDANLMAQGISLDEYRHRVARFLRAGRVQNSIANDARASLYELWLEYLFVSEKISLRVASYPVEKFAEKAPATEEELKAHLESHKQQYEIPAKRRYAYVKLSREDLRKKVAPTPEQLQIYYEQNQAAFRREEEVRVEDVFAPVNADQPTTVAQALVTLFADTVTTGVPWSDTVEALRKKDEKARLYFREVGWIGRDPASIGVYGKPYIDRAFGLADDRISTPVQGPAGMNIFRRLEHRPAGVKPREEIADELESKYKDEKAGEKFKEEAKRLKTELDSGRFSSLRDFAQAVGLEDGLTTTVLSTEVMIPGVGSLARDQAYLRNLKQGQMSGLFQTPDFLTALQVRDETKSHMPELDEVRESVVEAVKNQKALDLARAAANAALKRIQTGEEFATAVADSPTTTVLTQPFNRGQPIPTLGFSLLDFAEQSTRIDQGSTGMSAYGPSKDNPDGFAIWKVEKVESPTKAEFAKDRRAFEHEYLQVKQLTSIEEWLADRRRELDFEPLHRTARRSEEQKPETPAKGAQGG